MSVEETEEQLDVAFKSNLREKSDTYGEGVYDDTFLSNLRKVIIDLEDVERQMEMLCKRRKEIVSNLDKNGFNTIAIGLAMEYYRLPVEKRRNFDMSYCLLRLATGGPFQDDMFLKAEGRSKNSMNWKKQGM